MKTNPTTRRGFTLVELLVVIVIIAALAGLTAPMVIRQRKKADQTEAVSNARQIGLAMFEFEIEYGNFPDPSLGEIINTNVGGDLVAPTTITTSNDAFNQLLASGIANSEQIFFCKTAYSTIKPDNVFTKTEDALKKGDVGLRIPDERNLGLQCSRQPGTRPDCRAAQVRWRQFHNRPVRQGSV